MGTSSSLQRHTCRSALSNKMTWKKVPLEPYLDAKRQRSLVYEPEYTVSTDESCASQLRRETAPIVANNGTDSTHQADDCWRERCGEVKPDFAVLERRPVLLVKSYYDTGVRDRQGRDEVEGTRDPGEEGSRAGVGHSRGGTLRDTHEVVLQECGRSACCFRSFVSRVFRK